MKRIGWILVCAAMLSPVDAGSQGTIADYERAERFLPVNVERLVFHAQVQPHWIHGKSQFWYQVHTREGNRFVLVDAENNKKRPAFDHARLAKSLSILLNKPVEEGELPFRELEFLSDHRIRFRVDTVRVLCDLKNYLCESDLQKEDPARSVSPDGKYEAFVEDHNLMIRTLDSGEVFALTHDGEEKNEYSVPLSWYAMENVSRPVKSPVEEIAVSWSPDSKRLATFRLDRRKAQRLYLLQNMPDSGYRAQVWSYERELPGDTVLTLEEQCLFDISSRQRIPIDLPPYPAFISWGQPEWLAQSPCLTMLKFERGYNPLSLLEINAQTGTVRRVVEERFDTYVDPDMIQYRILEKNGKMIWASERSGWNQLYWVDWKTGRTEAITRGAFVVRSLVHVDEEKEIVYFLASGLEPGRDPYFQHLYRVNWDGSGLSLLTPEDAEHQVTPSEDGRFFVDTFSRVDLPPVTALRRMEDGRTIRILEEADIKDLLSAGWRFPERFSVKARDGKTELYGVLYRSSSFSQDRRLPVIDGTYTGPQAVRTPKTFMAGCLNSDQSLAELGFVVVTVDGLGTAKRSKAFHDVSHRNLGDIGAEDHIGAICQLAERYSYMDTSRVGIYGHSAGGYDAAHALLTHPEFYKVGVASAGNHDHRMSKGWWPELYMGYPVGPQYQEQSNLTLAPNLRGKLLLVHGDMDNNVNPANTFRLAGELIEANKDFDLLILPNRSHGLTDHPYFIRKRWDYFVKHLLGVDPPSGYKITSYR